MMRLSEPKYSAEQTIEECIAGITGNAGLRAKMTNSRNNLVALEVQYLSASSTGELYTIPQVNAGGNDDPIVISTLTKSDMVKVYEQYLVPNQKPARKIYDSLLNSAKEKCPFCGGIGTPRNLDHFLPKGHYPQFSILPVNLVPACRDCNMDGKEDNVATREEDQIIQPYSDKDIFFSTQWIFATYNANVSNEPGEFEYYPSPPGNWTDVDKKRVRKHFEGFNLARRYTTKAAELLGTVLQQIQQLKLAGLDDDVISTVLLQPGVDSAPFANHWQKGMYQALLQELL